MSATLQPDETNESYSSGRASAFRATHDILKKLMVAPTLAPSKARFIDKVKKIAAETRETQQREKRWAKQTALIQINAHLKSITAGLEAAIEREAKEKGNGVLTYQIVHPEGYSDASGALPQPPKNARAVIFEDDIRKTPGFAELSAKCAKIGVKLDLCEQWSNIAWNPYLGGNAAFVWQLTIYGW
ncbi:MAG: hypothetical protein ACREP5_00605 [Candidatus Binatia bacterium]